jgi:hypothetical protein
MQPTDQEELHVQLDSRTSEAVTSTQAVALRAQGVRPGRRIGRQVRSMARWEAAPIITIGLGIGLAIAATALLPLSQALNGGLPYIPRDHSPRSSASQRSWRFWPLRC